MAIFANKSSKHRAAWPLRTVAVAVGLSCLLSVLVLGTSISSVGGKATPCLQPLLLATQQATSHQQFKLLEQLAASACNLTAALDLPTPNAVAGMLHACQGHTCATLSATGYTPTLGDKAARVANTRAGFSMFVYPTQDIVSNRLADPKLRTWEQYELSQVKYALNQQLPSHPSAGSSSSSTQQRPLFIDVGANVGVFALNAAKLGARVYAFEGLKDNLKLLRSSLCINPYLQQHITLFPLGLSSKNDTCWVVSDDNNVGDGFTACGHNTSAEAQAAAQPGYSVRSSMLLRRLDDLVQEDVKVIKMDVEGHELKVLQGATNLLTKHRVWFIIAEANRDIIGIDAAYEVLTFLRSLGYRVSTKGFKGPWVTDAQVQQRTVRWRDVNVFAAHEELWGRGL